MLRRDYEKKASTKESKAITTDSSQGSQTPDFLQAVAGGYQVRPLSLLLSLLDLAKSKLLLLRPTEKAKELRAVRSR